MAPGPPSTTRSSSAPSTTRSSSPLGILANPSMTWHRALVQDVANQPPVDMTSSTASSSSSTAHAKPIAFCLYKLCRRESFAFMFPVTAQGRARDAIGNANNILPFGAEKPDLVQSARADEQELANGRRPSTRTQLRRRAGNIIWESAQFQLPKQIKLVPTPLPL